MVWTCPHVHRRACVVDGSSGDDVVFVVGCGEGGGDGIDDSNVVVYVGVCGDGGGGGDVIVDGSSVVFSTVVIAVGRFVSVVAPDVVMDVEFFVVVSYAL